MKNYRDVPTLTYAGTMAKFMLLLTLLCLNLNKK